MPSAAAIGHVAICRFQAENQWVGAWHFQVSNRVRKSVCNNIGSKTHYCSPPQKLLETQDHAFNGKAGRFRITVLASRTESPKQVLLSDTTAASSEFESLQSDSSSFGPASNEQTLQGNMLGEHADRHMPPVSAILAIHSSTGQAHTVADPGRTEAPALLLPAPMLVSKLKINQSRAMSSRHSVSPPRCVCVCGRVCLQYVPSCPASIMTLRAA